MMISRIVTVTLLLAMISTNAFCDEKQYTLQDAYAAALATNENIKIAEEGVVQADSLVDQAKSYIYPHLTANAGNTWYNQTIPKNGGDFLFQPMEQFHAGLVLTQPIYTGGRTLAAYRTAKTLGKVSRTQLTTSQQDMLMNVANAYFEVLKSQKLVDVSKDSLSRMEQYKKVTDRVAATRRTKANISDLLRAKTLVSQAGIFVVTTQDRLKIARLRLSLLTRLPENAVVTAPRKQEKPAEDLDRLKALALEHREDYAGALLNQKVADENITIVKGAYLPQVYAEGGIQYQDSRPTIITDETVYYGGIRLQIPIFEGGLMKAEVSSARSKLRQSEYSTKLLERNIETEVYEAYVNLQTLTTVLESTKLQYADAKENFDTVTKLFAEGLASSLAVIDSQQALFLAEREFVSVTIDREVAVLRLQKSIGMLGKQS